MVEIISWIQANPKLSVILIGVAISFLISLVNFIFMNKERIKEIKARQKKLNEEAKQHQKEGRMDKAMELQKQALAEAPEMLKHSMKPLLITIVPVLVLFAFIRNIYAETSLASTWLWWYIGASFVSSMVFRKLFKLP